MPISKLRAIICKILEKESQGNVGEPGWDYETISLYHKPSDMWTIPELTSETVPEYQFWCRKNNPVCEFVLYGSI